MKKVNHTLEPFYDNDSEILILGSFPSVKSREVGFYYMHPQNRFWKVLEIIFNENSGNTIEEKKNFLSKYHIALWDAIASCEIEGSSDSSIKCIKINDLSKIINTSKISKIYTTGKKAYDLYNKYCLDKIKIKAISLYSPSPANCAISLNKLVENYQVINIKKGHL